MKRPASLALRRQVTDRQRNLLWFGLLVAGGVFCALPALAVVQPAASPHSNQGALSLVAYDDELPQAVEMLAALEASPRSGAVGNELAGARTALGCWAGEESPSAAEACRQVFWTLIDGVRASLDDAAPVAGSDALEALRDEAADAAAAGSSGEPELFLVPDESRDLAGLGPVGTAVVDRVARAAAYPGVTVQVTGPQTLREDVLAALASRGVNVWKSPDDVAPEAGAAAEILVLPPQALVMDRPTRQGDRLIPTHPRADLAHR